METSDIPHSLPDLYKEGEIDYKLNKGGTESSRIARSILSELVEDVIDSVEVNRMTEMTQIAITKQFTATTASTFWKQTSSLAKRLFQDTSYKLSFLALCALCRFASHEVRAKDMSTAPRDLGSKLFAVETILEFCNCAGEKMRHSKVCWLPQKTMLIIIILITCFTLACMHTCVYAR